MARAKKSSKRANNEGSVYRRASTGKWVGSITLGYSPEGKRKRKEVTGNTQAEALAKLEAIKREVGLGTYSDDRQTLGDYLQSWLKDKTGEVRPRTLETYKRALGHVQRRIGHIQLAKLKPADVKRAIRDTGRKVGARSANQSRTYLHGALEEAVRLELLHRNPVKAVEPVAETPRTKVIWTPEQRTRFLETAKDHRLYAAFYLAASTGLRLGELLGVRWVDMEDGVLSVRQQVGRDGTVAPLKTASSVRKVGLPAKAVEVLDAHRVKQVEALAFIGAEWSHGGLVFVSQVNTPISHENFRRDFYKLQANTPNLPRATVHDLRHAFATNLHYSGVKLRTASSLLGHSRPSTTLDIYTAFRDDEVFTVPSLEPEDA